MILVNSAGVRANLKKACHNFFLLLLLMALVEKAKLRDDTKVSI